MAIPKSVLAKLAAKQKAKEAGNSGLPERSEVAETTGNDKSNLENNNSTNSNIPDDDVSAAQKTEKDLSTKSDLPPKKDFKSAAAKFRESLEKKRQAEEPSSFRKSEITFDMLNEQQKEAVRLAEKFEPFVLTGAAGTGKTTTQQMVIRALIESGKIPPIEEATKYLQIGVPGIAVVSFTNVAVNNISEVVPEQLKPHCVTIHKLIEMQPEWYEEYEENDDGDMIEVKKMRFIPGRNAMAKLKGLKLVIIEEASNVGTQLYQQLVDACPTDCMFMFLGDINQLKPVGDDGILGYKLSELPVIELTEVHRQAKESMILSFAHKILSGAPPASTDKLIETYKKDGELEFSKFKKRMDAEELMPTLGKAFQSMVHRGDFVAGEDMILCPFATGGHINTDQINKNIAQAFSDIADAEIHEVIAGRNKRYLAKGDLVYSKKESWRIIDIVKNKNYAGRTTRLPSKTMDRWGHDPNGRQEDFADILSQEIPAGLGKMDEEEIKNQSSHIVILENTIDGREAKLSTAGDFGDSDFSFGYSLTVHKAQGSEWKNVILVLHHSHAVSCSRELLYTAVTRAKKKLKILFEDGKHKYDPNSIIVKGIRSSQIKGNTLADKIAYFQDKIIQKQKIEEFKERKREERLEEDGEVDDEKGFEKTGVGKMPF